MAVGQCAACVGGHSFASDEGAGKVCRKAAGIQSVAEAAPEVGQEAAGVEAAGAESSEAGCVTGRRCIEGALEVLSPVSAGDEDVAFFAGESLVSEAAVPTPAEGAGAAPAAAPGEGPVVEGADARQGEGQAAAAGAEASGCLSRWPLRLPPSLEGRFFIGGPESALGEGSLALVRRCTAREDDRAAALKVMEKHPLVLRSLDTQVRREIVFQSAMRHPNVLQLQEFMEDDSHIYMVLEYAPCGGLVSLLKQQPGRRLNEQFGAWLFGQITSGMAYVHACGCIHRDLKPDNILLGERCAPKVSDFGWCAEVGEGAARKTMCGTLGYMAPEVIFSEGHGLPADAWSLGVLLYEVIAGHTPFAWSTSSDDLAKKVGKVEYPFPPWFSADLRQLVHCMLQRNPLHRWAPLHVLSHPWIAGTSHGQAAQAVALAAAAEEAAQADAGAEAPAGEEPPDDAAEVFFVVCALLCESLVDHFSSGDI
eukprot:CAMPEP_0183469828 /NCGR_PEP_ID=MMETSP0370-20130417/155194_1 /TAXON_ID=268820 /ORGANISM="Peridinium aciculiferum, Strain PAER-2" /LENGTH=478 /DNA_ID=CAMNT_0025662317 /DNA_START=19 /DNA_END=1456 /DNA_ORIENTATION=-